jgi:hypothetical protein
MDTKIESNKPLIIFFILAFAIAWGLMGLVIGREVSLSMWLLRFQPSLTRQPPNKIPEWEEPVFN